MSLDDRARDGESQPSPFTMVAADVVGAMEAFEQAWELVGGDGVASVAYREVGLIGTRLDLDCDVAAGGGVAERIGKQVGDSPA